MSHACLVESVGTAHEDKLTFLRTTAERKFIVTTADRSHTFEYPTYGSHRPPKAVPIMHFQRGPMPISMRAQ